MKKLKIKYLLNKINITVIIMIMLLHYELTTLKELNKYTVLLVFDNTIHFLYFFISGIFMYVLYCMLCICIVFALPLWRANFIITVTATFVTTKPTADSLLNRLFSDVTSHVEIAHVTCIQYMNAYKERSGYLR